MDEEMRDRIARLPAWVRHHIRFLEQRSESAVGEAARCRQKLDQERERCRRLSEQNEAMVEIFRRAATGGSDVAKTVVGVLEGYDFFPVASEKGVAS